jgi:hypothetical protein
MKKSTLLIVFACIAAITLQAQVKIGTTGAPNASAVLELDGGTNKGFLMPRLTNAQMIAIASPPNGLMVYNTTDNYVYLRSGGVWRPVPDGNNPLGAALPYDVGVNMPSTNVITVENVAGNTGFSVFRGITTGGNALSGTATTGNGVIGLSTTGNAGAFTATGINGVGGYFNSLNGPALITNNGNVGIGVPAPQFLLDVNGRVQLRHNGSTAGIWLNRSDNTAASFIGQLNDSTFGIYDGVDNAWKFAFNHSNYNVGIGTTTPKYPLVFPDALGDKISFYAGSTSNTTNHYGIGIQGSLLQFFTPTTSDDIAFGTGRSGSFSERFRFTGDGNLGIGTNNPTARLHVNGSVRIVDGQQGAQKVLTSDASGNASWQTPARQSNYGFYSLCNANQPGSTFGIVKFPSVFYNDGNPYDAVAGEYTAPEGGFYHFDAVVNVSPGDMSLNSQIRAELRINGTNVYASERIMYTGQPEIFLKISVSLYVGAGNKVAIYAATDPTAIIEGNESIFNGFKVY